MRYFLYIVAAALGSALLGGAFGCLIAIVSPEFVKGLLSPASESSLIRYAAALGKRFLWSYEGLATKVTKRDGKSGRRATGTWSRKSRALLREAE